MNIAGIQKMSLLDYPGKVAATLFVSGCNFRCPYCHNSELIPADAPVLMTGEECLAFLKGRRGLLDGVCVSGGEPTLQPGLPAFLREVKAMGFGVKLDTNGARPGVLRALAEEGLVDYVAMDMKSSPARYAEACGLPAMDLSGVTESLRFLLTGGVDYELRTTVVEELHTEEDFAAIAHMLGELAPHHKAKRYFLQPFADRDTVAFAGLHAPSEEKMQVFARVLRSAAETVEVRG